ncbi:MAG: TonB-dependent receptor [Candidatus Latescibacterota bacterium]
MTNTNSTDAQEFSILEEVVSISQGSGRFLESPAASTTVFNNHDLKQMQVSSIPEILESISAIHLTERGTPGSQSDISIRGSSLEGVLLLINGIPVRDPQTGHFFTDIPIDISSIDRVEILSGGGSTMYGSSASGGVVNIVISDAAGKTGGVSFGSFGTVNAGGSLSLGKKYNRINADIRMKRTSGYREGTDLRSACAVLSGTLERAGWDIRWNGGMLHKDFGAQGFYGPYPSYEKVSTFQGGVNAFRTFDDHTMIRILAGGRGHGDNFILIRDNPATYQNTHFNRSYTLSGEYSKTYKNDRSLIIGMETEAIGITSGKLGNHSDVSQALYSGFSGKIITMITSVSLRYDHGYRGEQVFSPGLGIVVPLGEKYKGRLRLERSFRSPTYTELYYDDPANHGDPGLLSEKSVSVETGIDRMTETYEAGISCFARRTTEVIDWVRNPGEKKWQAVNHGSILTSGIEGKINTIFIKNWKCLSNCTILGQKVRNRMGIESKYALNSARTTVSFTLYGPIVFGMICAVAARYENLIEGDSRTPVSLRLSKKFGSMNMKFSANNVTNEHYEEIPDLPAPGRRYTMEIEYIR